MYNIREASNILGSSNRKMFFGTSVTTNRSKYHVVLDGSFGGKICNRQTIKVWSLSFRMAVNVS